jgi:hypothetical protein
MEINFCQRLSKGVRRTAAAIAASGIAAASTVHAHPSNNLVLVAPAELPESARLPGDAMFLHEVKDGRTILYVEQKLGAQLAIFDVTDPSHVKSQGTVQMGAAGAFDFVSSLGSQKEIVRYREDQKLAVIDFHRAMQPSVEWLSPPKWPGLIAPVGDDGFIVNGESATSRESNDPESLKNYRLFDTARSDFDRVFDVKQVRSTISNQDTGTTFLLTGVGLYLIRQPTVEGEKKRRDEEWFWQHNGN